MKKAISAAFGVVLAVACSGLQGDAQTHIDQIMTSFEATEGLLPTAFAEAEIAAQHAALALATPDDIDAIKRHAGHVMNAIDPAMEAEGPGLGFGVKTAAVGVAEHVELAAGAADASPNVATHAVHVAAAANNVAMKADVIVALLQELQAETNASLAAMKIARVEIAVGQLISGLDADEDARISWDAPEGGLRQAQQHMELLMAGG